MKAGHFVGINWDKRRVVINDEFLMMEEFMEQYGVKETKDLIWIDILIHEEWNSRLSEAELKKAVRDLQVKVQQDTADKLRVLFNGPGGNNPSVSSIARNTNLFEPRGPMMGDF